MTSTSAARAQPSGAGIVRRIFFLGAGFSRPTGLPLASELLDLCLEEIHRDFPGDTKVEKSLDRYRAFIEATTGHPADPIDIESFMAYLDHDHILGLRGSDTWSEEGNEDQLMLRWAIGAAIHHATPQARDLPGIYVDFALRLRPHDVVVTFNYDLILETALDLAGVPFRRFPNRYSDCSDWGCTIDSEAEDSEVLILKVHGSIDWSDRSTFDRDSAHSERMGTTQFRDRNLVFGKTPVVRTSPLVEGPRPADDPLASVVVMRDLDPYYDHGWIWNHAGPLILAPSQAKLLYGQGLRELWRGMPGHAWGWGSLSVVGYSLPPADPYALQVLYELASGYVVGLDDPAWSIGPKSRVKVVDYRPTPDTVRELRKRYRFLDDRHTDFLLGGFSTEVLDELFS